MRVPQHSAWVPMEIDLSEFINGDGRINASRLRMALHRSVDEGDKRHDLADWGDPLLEYDSWLNRRLAIVLRGWGDIVVRRGTDPESLGTLREIERLAEWTCAVLHNRSRQLAKQGDWCPALDEAGAAVTHKRRAPAWCERWRLAIETQAVRHRNLTTLSPWDVFPRGKPADLRFANLLPLLRYADSTSFQCDVSISHWNDSDFNNFRERVAAIFRCNGGRGLVAKQV